MPKSKNNYIGIRDIAKMAGVSTATVSRVINNPSATSDKVRSKVQAIIDQYHYIPNQNIKNVFSKTSNSIAIFIYDMENPFFITLIKKLNQICLSNRYTLLICDTEGNSQQEKEYLDYCLSNRCSGIILTEGADYSLFDTPDMNIPLVSLDRRISPTFSTVRSDNLNAVKKVVDYLYNLNHRKIAFVGCKTQLSTIIHRKEGYLEALLEKNIPIHEEYIYEDNADLSLQSGKEALRYFLTLSDLPTAIICANDIIALGIINEARMLNLSIPDDLSVVGFDNTLDNIHSPRITTIRQDIDQMAESLFELLINPPDTALNKIIDTELIQGYTTKSVSLPVQNTEEP